MIQRPNPWASFALLATVYFTVIHAIARAWAACLVLCKRVYIKTIHCPLPNPPFTCLSPCCLELTEDTQHFAPTLRRSQPCPLPLPRLRSIPPYHQPWHIPTASSPAQQYPHLVTLQYHPTTRHAPIRPRVSMASKRASSPRSAAYSPATASTTIFLMYPSRDSDGYLAA